eukprot:gene33171-42898_t
MLPNFMEFEEELHLIKYRQDQRIFLLAEIENYFMPP